MVVGAMFVGLYSKNVSNRNLDTNRKPLIICTFNNMNYPPGFEPSKPTPRARGPIDQKVRITEEILDHYQSFGAKNATGAIGISTGHMTKNKRREVVAQTRCRALYLLKNPEHNTNNLSEQTLTNFLAQTVDIIEATKSIDQECLDRKREDRERVKVILEQLGLKSQKEYEVYLFRKEARCEAQRIKGKKHYAQYMKEEETKDEAFNKNIDFLMGKANHEIQT